MEALTGGFTRLRSLITQKGNEADLYWRTEAPCRAAGEWRRAVAAAFRAEDAGVMRPPQTESR